MDHPSSTVHDEMPLKVGIIGFGNFGQFIANALKRQGHAVLATSRSDYSDYCKEHGIQYFGDMERMCEEQPDVVLVCSSILSTESVIRKIPMHKLKSDTIFVDVLSVKQFPRNLFLELPESPNFKVELTLNVKQGGGPQSQFYLLDIGSCWKNNGAPCDGDVLTDVTRYSEMIINPQTQAWCSPTNLNACPPYHITPKDKKIYRNDTANFPYGAYHYYCSPGNAMHLEQPVSICDPYSNPQAQELVQIVPHPIWAEYGYPSKQGEGWIGDPRTWELDVGGLSSRLYFYQDPGTPPAKRIWTSVDVGTEIFISDKDEIAEWTLSDFNVILTSPRQ